MNRPVYQRQRTDADGKTDERFARNDLKDRWQRQHPWATCSKAETNETEKHTGHHRL